ncbi:MAG: hypothetical protein ACK4QL_11225 [Pseudanabaenaceae cyanobacterium]
MVLVYYELCLKPLPICLPAPIAIALFNGYDYIFVKLLGHELALSHNFSLLSDSDRNLMQVARILKLHPQTTKR